MKIRLLFLFILHLFWVTAHAAPSYIGPYRYYVYSPNTTGIPAVYWLASEQEAIDAAMVATLKAATPDTCNYRWGPPNIYDWGTTPGLPSPEAQYVEGVEASSEKGYWHIYNDIIVSDGTCRAFNPPSDTAWVIHRERLVCWSNQRYFDGKCVYVTALNLPGLKGANLGPTCASKGGHSCGEPINTTTGNMWHIEPDFVDRAGGLLSLRRNYNSQIFEPVRSNLFGNRWSVAFDATLKPMAASANYVSQKCYRRSDNNQIFCESSAIAGSLVSALAIEAFRGDGKYYVFNLNGSTYKGDKDTDDELIPRKSADGTIIGFDYKDAQAGTLETYDANGRLLAITTRAGVVHRLTYTDGTTNDTHVARYPADAPPCNVSQVGDVQPAGRLACVTDVWGRQDAFKYDAVGRVVEFVDPAGHSYFYEYDGQTGGCIPANASSAACGANNLTKVTYPDGANSIGLYTSPIPPIMSSCGQRHSRKIVSNQALTNVVVNP